MTFPNPPCWFHVTPTAALQGKFHTDVRHQQKQIGFHHLCHTSRWKVMGTSPCSASCDLGRAQRTVSCVQSVHGKESVVLEEHCYASVKPATAVPCLVQVCTFRWEVKPWSQVHVTQDTNTGRLDKTAMIKMLRSQTCDIVPQAFLLCHQCSVPCGYGIQSRAVSCVGPSQPEPLSPLLCMHIPKPITIQGCATSSCVHPTDATPSTVTAAKLAEDGSLPAPTLSSREPHTSRLPPSSTEAITIRPTGTDAAPTPEPS